MSMLSNALSPSACETDMTRAHRHVRHDPGLRAGPAALADWNNNYADDPDKCVLFHCSNFPQEFFGNKGVMDYQEILAGTVGREKTYGTLVGRLAPTDFTYCRVSTDDFTGQHPRLRRRRRDHRRPHHAPSAATRWRASRGSRRSCATSAGKASSTTWPSTRPASPRSSRRRSPATWAGTCTTTTRRAAARRESKARAPAERSRAREDRKRDRGRARPRTGKKPIQHPRGKA